MPSTPLDDTATAAQLDEIQQAVRQLRALLPPPTPDYEYSDPITFGGQQAALAGSLGSPYRLDNPFRTPCEYSIVSWTFGGAGTAFLTRDPNPSAPAAASSVIDGSVRQRGIVAMSNQAQHYPADSQYFPMQGADSLYLAISAAANAVIYVTVQFRRLQDRRGIFSEGASA